jgi:hypothetical protein
MEYLFPDPPAATDGGQDAVIAERTGPAPAASAPSTEHTANPFRYWTIRDLITNPPAPLTALVGLPDDPHGLGLIVAGSVSMIHAAPGSHKSWLALLIARAVASGQPLLEHYPVPSPGRVLYLDFEMGRPLWQERWRALDGVDPVGESVWDRLAVVTQDHEPAMALGDTEAILRMMDLVNGLDPDLIVVDTLANAASGDENDARAMADFMTAIRQVARARANPDTPAAVVVIHHDNKIGEYRGSTALNGALDDRWQLTANGDALELRHRKARLRKALPPVGWRLDVLPGGGLRGVHVPLSHIRDTTDAERDEYRMWDLLREMTAEGEQTSLRNVAMRFRADYIRDGDLADRHKDDTDAVLKRLVQQNRAWRERAPKTGKAGAPPWVFRANTTIKAG